MTGRSPREIANAHVDADERVLWAGAPDVEAAVSAYPRGISPFAGLAVLAGGGWFAARSAGVHPIDGLRTLWDAQPMALVVVGLMLLMPWILKAFRIDNRSRYRRYFENLTYAVTDRRLLVIEKDDVLGFEPGELNRPTVVERSGRFGDVIFARLPYQSSGESRRRDPVYLERRDVGFKAIPNAEETKTFIEQWIAGELAETAATVSSFVESATTGVAETGASSADGTRTIRAALGLTLVCPDSWSVQVRKKKKPFGKTFLDRAKWEALPGPDDWNTVQIEGPHGCEIVAEAFETPPLADYDGMANSRLAALAGELVDANPAVEQNGLRGFSVTRRTPVQVSGKTGTSGSAALVTPFRTTVLHDGRHQLAIFSRWPEDSPELTTAVEAVVRSVRLE